jgi:subtilisin family serine protease
MRGIRVVCAVTAFALFVVASAAAGGKSLPGTLVREGANRQFVPGEVVVRFQPSVAKTARAAIVENGGATVAENLLLPRTQLLRLAPGTSVATAVTEFERTPGVAYVEPNYLYHALATPNDTRFASLWGLQKISAPAAWDLATGASGVTVAVVDTGIATDHPDLAPNIVPGHDFVQNDDDARDFDGHGTHVAGTIGARGNNARGVTGVIWAPSLMPVRVLDGSGSGTDADVTSGFTYACTHGAKVVNASLGGGGNSHAMADAIAACPNTLFVVARRKRRRGRRRRTDVPVQLRRAGAGRRPGEHHLRRRHRPGGRARELLELRSADGRRCSARRRGAQLVARVHRRLR